MTPELTDIQIIKGLIEHLLKQFDKILDEQTAIKERLAKLEK